MGIKRITKKLMPALEDIDGAIIMVNASDPQLATVALFLSAVEHISRLVVLNKVDMVDKGEIPDLRAKLGDEEIITASIVEGRGLDEIEYRLSQWRPDTRIAVLGVFNSGKTSLINALTGSNAPTDDLPGTTLEFTDHIYKDKVLIDTVGQVIDVNMPLMVSVDLTECETAEEKLRYVMENDAGAILNSIESAMVGMADAVEVIIDRVKKGGKLVICGAGASGKVAEEMAGQAFETGIPVMVFTNDLAMMAPISFAKGLGEDEESLADYIALSITELDVCLGVSASGGTGFVFGALGQAQAKGATTIAITENRDTPLGKVADIIIKSEAKPEGPSSSLIQTAHLAIGHALILTVADERGVDASTAIEYMLPKTIRNKKMGMK